MDYSVRFEDWFLGIALDDSGWDFIRIAVSEENAIGRDDAIVESRKELAFGLISSQLFHL